MVYIGNSWDDLLKDEFKKEYYLSLREFLKREYGSKTVYPNMHDIFNSLKYTPFEDTKVVVLGQDPYHGKGQAHGLAFSVQEGVKKPPSLENIFKELHSDVGVAIPKSGNLTKWAKNGVLLLNTSLTVEGGRAGSHQGMGWEVLTDKIIELLSGREKPMVFILWGSPARRKKSLIDGKKHLIIEGVHPSPLSAYRGFFGGRYFSRANEFLVEKGIEPVEWSL